MSTHIVSPIFPLLLDIAVLKNWWNHIDASHSRQPLVKGERLVRYEVNAVIHRNPVVLPSCAFANKLLLDVCNTTWQQSLARPCHEIARHSACWQEWGRGQDTKRNPLTLKTMPPAWWETWTRIAWMQDDSQAVCIEWQSRIHLLKLHQTCPLQT